MDQEPLILRFKRPDRRVWQIYPLLGTEKQVDHFAICFFLVRLALAVSLKLVDLSSNGIGCPLQLLLRRVNSAHQVVPILGRTAVPRQGFLRRRHRAKIEVYRVCVVLPFAFG